jgi:hypothetical protein
MIAKWSSSKEQLSREEVLKLETEFLDWGKSNTVNTNMQKNQDVDVLGSGLVYMIEESGVIKFSEEQIEALKKVL